MVAVAVGVEDRRRRQLMFIEMANYLVGLQARVENQAGRLPIESGNIGVLFKGNGYDSGNFRNELRHQAFSPWMRKMGKMYGTDPLWATPQ